MVTTRSGRTYDVTITESTYETTAIPSHVATSVFVNPLSDVTLKKTFAALQECNDGLVFLGCGGNIHEWINGISELLTTESIVDLGTFDAPFTICSTGGRIDLVLPFAKGQGANGKLAMWRLRFGDASWISDYVVNYKKDHM